MKTKYTQAQLDEALTSVTAELTEMLQADSLAKGAKEDAPAEESEGSAPPAAPDESPAEESAEASAPPEGSAPPMEGSPEGSAPPEASPPGAPPGAEGSPGGEPPETVESLTQKYAAMGQQDPEALKMHFLAAKGAITALMGADQSAPPGAPPAAPPGPPAPAGPPPGSAPMAMSEKMSKSEAEVKLEGLEKQLKEQNQEMLNLVEAVKKLTTPIRKSIKGVSDMKFVARTEEKKVSPVAALTKSEITKLLREKVRDGNLSKSDKSLVSQYAVGGVDVSKIEHLLVASK